VEAFTTVGIVFVLLIIGALFLFFARRILRLALKLAFAMALVFVLVAGAAVGWWQGWFSSPSSSARPAKMNQRTNANRRPTPR
jgi:cell division protein FtsW (lipid II flippase)